MAIDPDSDDARLEAHRRMHAILPPDHVRPPSALQSWLDDAIESTEAALSLQYPRFKLQREWNVRRGYHRIIGPMGGQFGPAFGDVTAQKEAAPWMQALEAAYVEGYRRALVDVKKQTG